MQCRRYRRQGFDLWVGKIPWRRKWQPTPIFLPEKSNELRSPAGYSSKGHKESNTTKHAHHPLHNFNDINTFPAKQVLLFGLEHHLSFQTQNQLKLILISTHGYICSIWIKIGHLWGFSGSSVIKNLPTNAGGAGSVPDLGRSHMLQSNKARVPQRLSLGTTPTEPLAKTISVVTSSTSVTELNKIA